MKTLGSTMLTVFVLLLVGLSVSAQSSAPPPPPPPVPDYNPASWKEYSFPDDNIRFRFPVAPSVEESTAGTVRKIPTRVYSRASFMLFQLTVILLPDDMGLEANENVLAAGVQGGLDRIKKLRPKIITQEDTLVDGHPAKFLKLETNDGLIMRWKIIGVKNKLYTAFAISKKGDRHGFNWENDFEIPAMAFLDSLHITETK